MNRRATRAWLRALTGMLLAFLIGPWCTGQSAPQRHVDVPPSRIELFGGFGYFHPYSGEIGGYGYQPIDTGAVTSLSVYFNRHLGMQAEGGFHPDGPNDCVYTAQGGPVVRVTRGRWVPFVHVLGGGSKVGGPVFQPCTWGWGVTAGLGADYVLPRFGNRLALRILQADWQFSQVTFGPLMNPAVSGGTVDLGDYRLASGIVLRFGSLEKLPPLQLSCSLQPETVFVGDPVVASLKADNLDPRRPAQYGWTSTGGTVHGGGETATIDTAGLSAGNYTVTATVVQGPRRTQSSSCKAAFTVRGYDPPALTCAANPSSVMPGATSLITGNGISPQNRPLVYSFSPDAGRVGAVEGNSTQLDTRGIPVSTVTVTCRVVDDLGKGAMATTTVTILPPPPPPPPPTRALCSIEFTRDRKRPTRVDNEAKGCLDDIALALGGEPDARLVIVGHAGMGDQPDAAAQRALNTRRYLSEEKGIDGSRIEVRTGAAAGRSVESILVPAGASFLEGDTTVIDESKIKREEVPRKTPRR